MKKLISRYKWDRYIALVSMIIVPGTMIHALNEFLAGGTSIYFIRDIVVIMFLILVLIGTFLQYITRRQLVNLSIYSVVSAIATTFIMGYFDHNFRFEPNFLQAEMLLSLLMLVHYKQIKNLLIFNFLLVVICYFTVGHNYPLDKLIYNGLIVCGSGVLSYITQRSYAKLSRKVREAYAVIRKQNRELREMNTAKDQLFKIIGHDLRTPFYQLRYLVEMIADEKDEIEKQKIKKLLIESADNGNQLLEDLLNWGKNYQNKSEVSLEKKAFCKILKRAISFSKLIAAKKEITLTDNVCHDLELFMNPMMMETVLRNLIANAIKFSHRGSEIIVRSVRMNDQIRIDVIDKGVGITEERLRLLFVNDKNHSTIGTENEKGSGNGLVISKKLVERQNGIFEIASTYNKGTTVHMYFPAC